MASLSDVISSIGVQGLVKLVVASLNSMLYQHARQGRCYSSYFDGEDENERANDVLSLCYRISIIVTRAYELQMPHRYAQFYGRGLPRSISLSPGALGLHASEAVVCSHVRSFRIIIS